MTIKVGINGFGRIGRMVFRAAVQNFSDIEIVGINEPASLESMAYLTRFDSTHGRFPGEVKVDGDELVDALGHHRRVPVRAARAGARAERDHACPRVVRDGGDDGQDAV